MNSFCFLKFNTKSNKCQFWIYKDFKIQRKNFINKIFILAKFNKNFKQKKNELNKDWNWKQTWFELGHRLYVLDEMEAGVNLHM